MSDAKLGGALAVLTYLGDPYCIGFELALAIVIAAFDLAAHLAELPLACAVILPGLVL
jgi:hypothetical protein